MSRTEIVNNRGSAVGGILIGLMLIAPAAILPLAALEGPHEAVASSSVVVAGLCALAFFLIGLFILVFSYRQFSDRTVKILIDSEGIGYKRDFERKIRWPDIRKCEIAVRKMNGRVTAAHLKLATIDSPRIELDIANLSLSPEEIFAIIKVGVEDLRKGTAHLHNSINPDTMQSAMAIGPTTGSPVSGWSNSRRFLLDRMRLWAIPCGILGAIFGAVSAPPRIVHGISYACCFALSGALMGLAIGLAALWLGAIARQRLQSDIQRFEEAHRSDNSMPQAKK